MNNAQLYLALAIPSVLVVLSWISNNTRLTAMEKRIDSLEGKIDRLEVRLEDNISRLDAKLDRRFDDLTFQMGELRERVAVVESKQD